MHTENDPRTVALLALGRAYAPELVEWLLRNFEVLEHTDFGELEPVGVCAPIGEP